jgi:hypothetical protein
MMSMVMRSEAATLEQWQPGLGPPWTFADAGCMAAIPV